MYTLVFTVITAVVLSLNLSPAVASANTETASANKARKTMRAFRSEAELTAYLKNLAAKHESDRRQILMAMSKDAVSANLATAEMAPPAAPPGVAAQNEPVTNVQHAGVDEGSLVKVHGDHLVILRRGRLFTVSLAGRGLTPISSADAFGPDVDPEGTWYDEMLVSDDTVVVIGYSYARGGTEVGLFHIDPAGQLTYQATYQMRSNDYYSSRNYASRLIGHQLIFYSPLYLSPTKLEPYRGFPAVRRWHKGASEADFHRISTAAEVYQPESMPTVADPTLHTVTVCDLEGGSMDCKGTSAIGPPGHVFYVSPESVYVWMSGWGSWWGSTRSKSMLYRMPLDGSAPSALKVNGSPIDQFSFLESEDGYLNVLVRANGSGDGMWRAEGPSGPMALIRVALASFSDGSEAVPSYKYRKLPAASGYDVQNRYIGDYLLYGAGDAGGGSSRSALHVVRWTDGDVRSVPLQHRVERIEQLGSDALVVGSKGSDLHFTSVRLGDTPEVASDFVQPNAAQGETRSHGFFYKPDTRDSGLLGLPLAGYGSARYRDPGASIVFLRNDSLHLKSLGELVAQTEALNDNCRASCVDWYGNAQPLFLRGRVLALLGYELVEGKVVGGHIYEAARVNFSHGLVTTSRR